MIENNSKQENYNSLLYSILLSFFIKIFNFASSSANEKLDTWRITKCILIIKHLKYI